MALKGALLCGGLGTRLQPCTDVVNKHLLAVAGLPMVEYPLHTLLRAGVREIVVVAGGEHIGAFLEYLGSGSRYGCRFWFISQDGPGGIAQAIACTEGFIGPGDRLMVVLGDNLFGPGLLLPPTHHPGLDGPGAGVYITDLTEKHRFGVLWFIGDGSIGGLVEKPDHPPKDSFVLTGLYVYGHDVYDRIRKLEPSARGELEVTDLNKSYLGSAQLDAFAFGGFWSDMGTPESLRVAQEWLWKNPGFLASVGTNRKSV